MFKRFKKDVSTFESLFEFTLAYHCGNFNNSKIKRQTEHSSFYDCSTTAAE